MSERISEATHPSGTGGRFFVRVLTVLTCALIGYGVWWQLFRDEKPRNPLQTNEEEITVPERENGLVMLAESVVELQLRYSTPAQFDIIYNNRPWDAQVMRTLLEPAGPLREAVEEALKQPEWLEDKFNGRTVSSLGLKNAAEVFAAKCLELEQGGQLMEGGEWLSLAQALTLKSNFQNVDLPHHMECASACRIIRKILLSLVARHPDNRDLAAKALELVRASSMDFAELRRGVPFSARAYLEALPEWEAKANEQAPAVAKLRELSATRLPVWFLRSRYKPEATRNLLAVWFEELESKSFREDRESRNAILEFQSRIESEMNSSPFSFDSNRAGRILAASTFQFILGLENGYFLVQEAERRCQSVVLAARLYSLDHNGGRPESLEKLVPEYLSAIPLDPYDGQPVRWIPSTGMAYVSGDDATEEIPKPTSKSPFSSPERNGAWAQLP